MGTAARIRSAVTGLGLALSVAGCAGLLEERGKAPVGANLERLAAAPGSDALGESESEPGMRLARGDRVRLAAD